ncbi:hypothetical protein [Endozoicomonas sp. YOMI1]|uniref:hypothetical protein n=1 Tax=Endozoicomonas sp. YOMI1 TaxID=2828739 RepID=UPI002148A668|nr:hypothetical protein [Endozoicomonas sp. YOMI1]
MDDIAETRSFRHTKIPCPSITTFEPHHKPACTWEGPYQEVKSHLDECIGIPDRTKLMMQGLQIKELQGKLTNAEKKQSTMIESLNQKYEALDQRFNQKLKQDSDGLMPLLGGTIGYVCNSIEAIDKIRTRLDRLEARTGNMEQQSNGAVRRCIRQFVAANLAAERRYLTNQQRAILTAGTLSPVASPDNTGKCVDVFLWRIDGFQSWLADAVSKKNQSYYSPAVYTTDCYCVSGQISPYEHDSGRSYLRVYVALWQGQYDKQISWPMSKIITLSLVNQNDPRKNEAVTFASDDKPGFQTPPNLVNTGWGFPKFLMLNDLDNTEFVKNDSLHLEIVLEDPLPRSGTPEGH